MILSVELPDSIAHQMYLEGAQGQRRVLETLALDGYRGGRTLPRTGGGTFWNELSRNRGVPNLIPA